MENGGGRCGLLGRGIGGSRSWASATARSVLGTYAVVVLKVVAAVLATALAAEVKVPVPGSPVPITLQTLAVLWVGFLLGSRLAPLAMLAYLVLGAAGLPFFAAGRSGVTGGYRVGFVLAAAVVGHLGSVRQAGWLRNLAVAVGGIVVVFVVGLLWLAAWLPGGWSAAVTMGLIPFWPGEVMKIGVAVAAVQAWRRSAAGPAKR